MTLPPLPYIHAGWQWRRTATYRGALPANANRADWNQLFTADQLLAYAEQAVAAERARCLREIKSLHWTPRVQGRWDETDVAHAEGFNMAKTKALLVLWLNARLTGPQRPAQE